MKKIATILKIIYALNVIMKKNIKIKKENAFQYLKNALW
jgi:hypothetical protein